VPYPTAGLGWELMKAMETARERVPTITVPTLVMHGGADRLVPATSTEIFETLAGAERRVYGDLRHELFNEPGGLELVDEAITWINDQLLVSHGS
jgi:alpha-beta hydrolase superfamily lysophospholipase